MKPFNLEAAKRGEPIVTRDGRTAKYVGYTDDVGSGRVVLVIQGTLVSRRQDGVVYSGKDPQDGDLFMAPTKHSRWVWKRPNDGELNLVVFYTTKEAAMTHQPFPGCVLVHAEWEE